MKVSQAQFAMLMTLAYAVGIFVSIVFFYTGFHAGLSVDPEVYQKHCAGTWPFPMYHCEEIHDGR